jgi:hypothetical protein
MGGISCVTYFIIYLQSSILVSGRIRDLLWNISRHLSVCAGLCKLMSELEPKYLYGKCSLWLWFLSLVELKLKLKCT